MAAEMNRTDTKRPLPPGWRWVRLEEVSEIASGVTLGRKVANATRPVPYLRVANVKDGRLDLSDVYEIEATDSEIEKYRLKYGDLLLTEGGDPDKLGRGTFWKEEISDCIHQNHIFRVRLKLEQFSPEFLAYLISSPHGKNYFLANSKRTTGIATINRKVLGAFPILAPPLPEQKRIAAILTEQMAAVEQARAAAEAQLEAAKALPAAYLRTFFTSPEARSWPQKLLGEVGEIVSGITIGRKLTNREETRSVPYLRVANVKDGHLDLSEVYEVEATESEIKKLRLKIGDILLTEGGDPDKLGRGTFWWNELPECIHQNHIFRVRFNVGYFSPLFISYQIASSYGKAYFLTHAKRTTGIATINQKVLAAFPLMVPPIQSQRAIAKALWKKTTDADRLRRSMEKQLNKINALPAALLRRAFNGEL